MTHTTALPAQIDVALDWVRDSADVAESKKGGHDTTFRTACTLVGGFELGDADVMSCLEAYNATKCVPPWSAAELMHKLASARGQPLRYPQGWLYRKILRERGLRGAPSAGPTRGTTETPAPKFEQKWKLDFDIDALRAVQPVKPVSEAWLAERSPLNVATSTSADFLRAVFAPDDMVLIFTKFASQGQYMWWRERSYRLADRPGLQGVRAPLPKGGDEGVWYLSQPVNGRWEPNPREMDKLGRPKLSRRSEESITSWRHLVLEADPVDEVKRDPVRMAEFERLWLGFLVTLPLPIKAIYTSGGKSTHALVWLPCDTKERFDAMKKMLGPLFSKLGADPRAMKAVQLTRLPGCMRGDRRQRLLYLDPSPPPEGVPLIELHARPLQREGHADV